MTIRHAATAGVITPGEVGWSRVNKTFGGAFPVTTKDLVTGNGVAFCIVPPDFVVTGISGSIPKMDNGTALLLQLGDLLSPNRLFSSSAVGQAGGSMPAINPAAFAYKYPGISGQAGAHNEIILSVLTGAATPVAGTPVIYISGFVGP